MSCAAVVRENEPASEKVLTSLARVADTCAQGRIIFYGSNNEKALALKEGGAGGRDGRGCAGDDDGDSFAVDEGKAGGEDDDGEIEARRGVTCQSHWPALAVACRISRGPRA